MYIKNDRPDIIHILNFKGTKKEAIAKIKEDYRSDPDVRDAHIKRINRCFKKANKWVKANNPEPKSWVTPIVEKLRKIIKDICNDN